MEPSDPSEALLRLREALSGHSEPLRLLREAPSGHSQPLLGLREAPSDRLELVRRPRGAPSGHWEPLLRLREAPSDRLQLLNRLQAAQLENLEHFQRHLGRSLRLRRLHPSAWDCPGQLGRQLQLGYLHSQMV